MEGSAWTHFPHAVKKTAEDGTSLSTDNFVSFQIRGLSSLPVMGFGKLVYAHRAHPLHRHLTF